MGKFEASALDDDVQAADLIQEFEAKIAALERMVGRQALEIELLKGAPKHAPRPQSGSISVVTGPTACDHGAGGGRDVTLTLPTPKITSGPRSSFLRRVMPRP